MLSLRTAPFFKALLLSTIVAGTPAYALVEIPDEQMSEVSGAGLAIALDDFRFAVAPTSYTELTGTAPSAAAAAAGWERGDARYYGFSITGNGAGTDWYGNGCSTAGVAGNLGCALGASTIAQFAPVFNPFLVRVFQYNGHDYQGTYLSGASRPTIFEFIAPSASDSWRWSFWGELEVDRDGAHVQGASHAAADFLQSQSVILGKPSTTDGQAAVFRLMRTSNSSDPTFGMTYHSRLSGDFRFSVRQTSNSPDTLHSVPDFNDNEGMFFRNVDAFLPLGQLHYQALVLDSDGTSGNFTIELMRIPNVANVYNHFYCGVGTNAAPASCTLAADGSITSPNADTHGYVRWGNWSGVSADGTTGANLPGSTSTTNGIYFIGGNSGTTPLNNVTNLGISRVEGMLIHHVKITTLGAGGP